MCRTEFGTFFSSCYVPIKPGDEGSNIVKWKTGLKEGKETAYPKNPVSCWTVQPLVLCRTNLWSHRNPFSNNQSDCSRKKTEKKRFISGLHGTKLFCTELKYSIGAEQWEEPFYKRLEYQKICVSKHPTFVPLRTLGGWREIILALCHKEFVKLTKSCLAQKRVLCLKLSCNDSIHNTKMVFAEP